MVRIIDKILGKSKRPSKSGEAGYSSGAGSDSDVGAGAGGRSSASFEQPRPLTRDYGRGTASGILGAGAGTGAGRKSMDGAGAGAGRGQGYESLPNGSSVLVNQAAPGGGSSTVPPPVPPKEEMRGTEDTQGALGSTQQQQQYGKGLARKPSPIETEGIPPRSTSLDPAAAKITAMDQAAGARAGTGDGHGDGAGDGVSDSMSKLAIKGNYTGDTPQFHRRSLDGKHPSSPLASAAATSSSSAAQMPAHESPHQHQHQHRDVAEQHHRHPDTASPRDVLDMDAEDFEEPETVIQARKEMAERIAAEARAGYKGLDGEGRALFEKAGLVDNLDNRGEVEVRTEWLKPVVHETIRPIVHTEITEVVTIDRHIHHIYPKIQPIHDPDPIRLPPRHRIFDPTTSAWHEVIGDEAALAILGPAAFYNGWREYREYRAPALPGLTEDGEVLVFSEMRGSKEPQFEARQIEREGERGTLSSSSWKALKGKLDGKGEQGDDARMIGEVDNTVGKRTMGIKI